jgi:hypothetical protein
MRQLHRGKCLAHGLQLGHPGLQPRRPAADGQRPPRQGRVGKNPGFKKKPAQRVFFFWFFHIIAQKREFLGFFQFQEYF